MTSLDASRFPCDQWCHLLLKAALLLESENLNPHFEMFPLWVDYRFMGNQSLNRTKANWIEQD